MATEKSLVKLTEEEIESLERLKRDIGLGQWKTASVSPHSPYSGNDDFDHFNMTDKYEIYLSNIDKHLSRLVNIENKKLAVEEEKSAKLSGIATLIAIGILAKIFKKYL